MALTVGTNSWITRADADTYFSEKYGAGAWATLTDSVKDQLLISAFRWIQQQSKFTIPASSTAEIVKQAQCEAAWFIYNYWTEYTKRQALTASGVKSFKISNFSETLELPTFPIFIGDMLDGFVTSQGGVFPTVSRELDQG